MCVARRNRTEGEFYTFGLPMQFRLNLLYPYSIKFIKHFIDKPKFPVPQSPTISAFLSYKKFGKKKRDATETGLVTRRKNWKYPPK